jgi:putative Mg2+ transporter-C (MgtC) family protein
MGWHELASILLAILFGAVIGLERELSQKAAGLRTNVLICLGAAVFTIIARHLSVGNLDANSRIVAQIITGVGFLGAGAIIRETGGIHGLTTAATIWLVASIGTACGGELYYLAAVSTLVAILILFGLGRLEKPLAEFRNRDKARSPKQDDKSA